MGGASAFVVDDNRLLSETSYSLEKTFCGVVAIENVVDGAKINEIQELEK
jgi:hypothetical protein